VDSLDRAMRELFQAGAVHVEERWDISGAGGQLTNDYHLLERPEDDPSRTAAAPSGRMGDRQRAAADLRTRRLGVPRP